MWIPARFFDISKRRDTASPLFVLGMLCLLGLSEAGCVVTDKIEFDDAVNQPISIERDTPVDPIVSVSTSDNRNFTVTVWDWDVDDPDPAQNSIEGKVEIRADYWSTSVLRECNSLVLSSEETDTDVVDTSLPRFTIVCPVDLKQFDALEESLVEVRIVVSDLGFFGDTPRPNAQTAEMLWVLRVQEDD